MRAYDFKTKSVGGVVGGWGGGGVGWDGGSQFYKRNPFKQNFFKSQIFPQKVKWVQFSKRNSF